MTKGNAECLNLLCCLRKQQSVQDRRGICDEGMSNLMKAHAGVACAPGGDRLGEKSEVDEGFGAPGRNAPVS
jgi:hypothetical protein